MLEFVATRPSDCCIVRMLQYPHWLLIWVNSLNEHFHSSAAMLVEVSWDPLHGVSHVVSFWRFAVSLFLPLQVTMCGYLLSHLWFFVQVMNVWMHYCTKEDSPNNLQKWDLALQAVCNWHSHYSTEGWEADNEAHTLAKRSISVKAWALKL
jgi:hypothetical protein